MKSISIPVTNRPEYLRQTLECIKNNVRAIDYKLFINVEPLSEECIQICKDIDWIGTDVEVNAVRLGSDANPYRAIQRAFDAGSEFNVHFDDDLLIGPDTFHLLDWYYLTYKDAPLSYISYSVFNYNSDPAFPDKLDTVYKYFSGLGWAVFREGWDAWYKTNWFDDRISRSVFSPETIGWDWVMSGVAIQNGLDALQPSYSRTNHAGRLGGTYCTEEIQDRLFANLKWNKDLIVQSFSIKS